MHSEGYVCKNPHSFRAQRSNFYVQTKQVRNVCKECIVIDVCDEQSVCMKKKEPTTLGILCHYLLIITPLACFQISYGYPQFFVQLLVSCEHVSLLQLGKVCLLFLLAHYKNENLFYNLRLATFCLVWWSLTPWHLAGMPQSPRTPAPFASITTGLGYLHAPSQNLGSPASVAGEPNPAPLKLVYEQASEKQHSHNDAVRILNKKLSNQIHNFIHN